MFLHSHCAIHVLSIKGHDGVLQALQLLVSAIFLQLLVNIPSPSRGAVMQMEYTVLRPRMKAFVQFEGILRSPAPNSVTSTPTQTPRDQQHSRTHQQIVPPAPYPNQTYTPNSMPAFARRLDFDFPRRVIVRASETAP